MDKEKRVTIRFTIDEYDVLKQAAQDAGDPLAHYIRKLLTKAVGDEDV